MKRDSFRKTVLCAVFCAFAYVCVFLFRFKVGFLTFDLKDAFITIAAMLMGPVAGISISAAVAFLEFLTVSDTAFYGLLMNFLSSATFSAAAGLVYARKRTMSGAISALLLGVFSMSAVMLAANLAITPLFLNTTSSAVLSMIPALLLPFNLLKGTINAALVLLLYKPISRSIKRISPYGREVGESYAFGRRSLLILIAGVLVLSIAVFLFLFLLKGDISIG